jgi:mannose-1-phosphate guanylyltransferase
MVLGAGLGTRLRPLSLQLPKPAVPVANKPLGWFALDWLERNRIREVVINTHHLATGLERALEPHLPEGQKVELVHEPYILGTGGGVKNGWKPSSGELFVVVNGDVILAPDLEKALEAHQRLGAVATMVVRQTPDPDRYGAVEADPGGRVRRILGSPKKGFSGLQKYMFSGVHILDPRAWNDLPAEGCIVRESYRRWLERGETVGAFVDPGPWMEVGTVESYLEANLALASGRVAWPGIKSDKAGILVHGSAHIGRDVVLDRVVIGPGATVADGVKLRRVVVWEGVRADSDEQDAVLTPSGAVRVGS